MNIYSHLEIYLRGSPIIDHEFMRSRSRTSAPVCSLSGKDFLQNEKKPCHFLPPSGTRGPSFVEEWIGPRPSLADLNPGPSRNLYLLTLGRFSGANVAALHGANRADRGPGQDPSPVGSGAESAPRSVPVSRGDTADGVAFAGPALNPEPSPLEWGAPPHGNAFRVNDTSAAQSHAIT